MLHKIVLFVSLIAVSAYSGAQTLEINPDRPDQYIVVLGDTLWDISGRFLVEPWRWPEIWRVNPEIENPHLIYPGDIIRFSYEGGMPILTVERGETAERGETGDRNVKLSPSIRVSEHRQAIHTIPIDVIRPFLTRQLIVGEGEIERWPYVLSSYEQHLIIGPEIEIYVRDLPASDIRNYSIYRKGPAYISYSRGYEEVLGYEAMYIGETGVLEYGDPSTAVVIDPVKEVMVGDRLREASDEEIFTNFFPSSPENEITGSIISAEGVLTEIGQYQVIVLDRGTADGVEIGNVFAVYQRGKVVRDKVKTSSKAYENTELIEYMGKLNRQGEPVTLPNVRAGVAMVFRTFDRVSYALVMEATIPIHFNDIIKSL